MKIHISTIRAIIKSFQSTENSPHSSKNNLQHFQLSDTTGTSKGTGFYGQMKQQKKAFQQQTLKMGLMHTGIKKIPHVYN